MESSDLHQHVFGHAITSYCGIKALRILVSFKFVTHTYLFLFITEFEGAAKIRDIALYRFLISRQVPELLRFEEE